MFLNPGAGTVYMRGKMGVYLCVDRFLLSTNLTILLYPVPTVILKLISV
jgi:hypothetical protein